MVAIVQGAVKKSGGKRMSKVAFLGLGAMGSRMAKNILAAGFELTVWNRTSAATRSFEEQGATLAKTPREAATSADIVIAMVTDDQASEQVWCSVAEGALTAMKPGAVAIESSTLTPAWIAKLAAKAAEQSVKVLDAPVSGSRPQAEARQLVFMVGGDKDAFEIAKPVLASTGLVNHVGSTGHGSLFKLAVNSLLGVQTAAWAEMLGFLKKNGVDMNKALNLLTAMPVCSPAAAGQVRMMAAQNFAPMFPNALLAKDYVYLQQTAAAQGSSTPISDASAAVYQKAAKIIGEENFNSVIRFYES
jgi:3-hydroxyisobutyrate dehydrogenase